MRVWRSGSQTDSKGPAFYIKRWKDSKRIRLNGTINKQGSKNTWFELEIEEDDVIALFNTLVEDYRERVPQLTRDLEECRTEFKKLLKDSF